jgi:hypothetical protein
LLLAGPIARKLYYERYPADRLELVILIGGLALLGAGLAVGSFRLHRFASDLVCGALLFIYLDLEFDPERYVPIELVAFGCLAAAIAVRQRRATITCIVLVAFDLASLPSRTHDDRAFRGEPATNASGALPPIVHVVLDEHLGIGGFRALGDSATADFVSRFFVGRGFDVFAGAYSRFFQTQNSVPSILSLGQATEADMMKWGDQPPFRLRTNPYFSGLYRAGYDLHVYESANLQFCETPAAPVSSCVEIPPNSVANIAYMPITAGERSVFVLEYYFRHASALLPRLGRWLPELPNRRLFAGRGASLLDHAGTDLVSRGGRRSEFVFVHLLLPHSPYEVNDRCEPYPRSVLPIPMTGPVTDSLLRVRWNRYRLQVQCTYRLLGRFLDRVEQAYGPGRAIVIVHGDHGARGTPVAPDDGRLAAFRREDLTAGFSTALAVRSPATHGAVHLEPVPLQDFLWAFARSGFKALPTGEWRHFVYSTATANPDEWTPRPLAADEMPWATIPEP